MAVFEKIYPYILPTLESLILLWMVVRQRKNIGGPLQPKYFFIILGLQLAAHAYSMIRLGYQIHNQLGFQAMPPYNQYFLTEALGGIQPLFVGAIHGALWMLLLWYAFIRRSHGTMLDVNDIYLLTLGIVAAGWPGGLLLLAVTFALTVIWMIVLVIARKKSLTDRLIISPWIIPATILMLYFGNYLLAWTHLDKIRF